MRLFPLRTAGSMRLFRGRMAGACVYFRFGSPEHASISASDRRSMRLFPPRMAGACVYFPLRIAGACVYFRLGWPEHASISGSDGRSMRLFRLRMAEHASISASDRPEHASVRAPDEPRPDLPAGKESSDEPPAALRAAVPTRGLYLSGHHFFMGQTPCERMAPAGVRWGAAGSREAASRGGRRRRFRAGRTSHGLVATFPRAKPIFPASGHETAPRPSAAAKAPGVPERSGGGAQRLAFAAADGRMLSSCRKQENHVSFFPGPSGVRGTEGPYLTNLSADPPGATNQRYVFRTPTPDCASTDLGRDGTHGRRAAPSSSQHRPSRTSRRLTSPRGTSLGRTTAP